MSKRSFSALLVAGSPSTDSRSTWVLRRVRERLERSGFRIEEVSVDDFEPTDLLKGRFDRPTPKAFLEKVKGAELLVVASPVYKSTYAGALKTIVDLIEPTALDGKYFWGIATARLSAHLSTVVAGYEQLVTFFRGSRGIEPLVLLDSQVGSPGAFALERDVEVRIDSQVAGHRRVVRQRHRAT
ncbi:MAG: NAD(P)H-dependent oxidoreductase [Polyangiaceae bacterium]